MHEEKPYPAPCAGGLPPAGAAYLGGFAGAPVPETLPPAWGGRGGLAAALCLGGTAVATGVSGGFPLFFPKGEDAALSDYIAVPAGVVTDENDHYRMTVDAFLFDEATGTGLVRLHIENKAGDGVRPFEVLAYYPSTRTSLAWPGAAWSRSGAMEMGSWPSR